MSWHYPFSRFVRPRTREVQKCPKKCSHNFWKLFAIDVDIDPLSRIKSHHILAWSREWLSFRISQCDITIGGVCRRLVPWRRNFRSTRSLLLHPHSSTMRSSFFIGWLTFVAFVFCFGILPLCGLNVWAIWRLWRLSRSPRRYVFLPMLWWQWKLNAFQTSNSVDRDWVGDHKTCQITYCISCCSKSHQRWGTIVFGRFAHSRWFRISLRLFV
jgi:hypothetical protein